MVWTLQYIVVTQPTNLHGKERKIRFPNWHLILSRLSSPFINIFDPGTKDWAGTVVHTITKEDWRLFRRYKDGERNLTYLDGREFKPGRDIVAEHLQPAPRSSPYRGGRSQLLHLGQEWAGLGLSRHRRSSSVADRRIPSQSHPSRVVPLWLLSVPLEEVRTAT